MREETLKLNNTNNSPNHERNKNAILFNQTDI